MFWESSNDPRSRNRGGDGALQAVVSGLAQAVVGAGAQAVVLRVEVRARPLMR